MSVRPPLWRHSDFLRLWAGQAASELGSQVSLIAIPLVAVVTLHTNAFQTGLLETFQFAPFLLFGLVAGVFVDRMPRRRILIAADCGRLVLFGSIPVAAALGVLTLVQLYAVGFLAGILTVFFDVAYQSVLPSLVPAHQIVDANAKLTFTQSVAELLGPGLGGLLAGTIGAARAVAVDALSYALSVVSLLTIGAREVNVEREQRRPMRAEIGEGLRYVLGHRQLRAIAACTALSNLSGHATLAILILYAVRELHLSPTTIGIWFSLGTIGAPLAALVVERVRARLGVGKTILASALVFSIAGFAVPLAPTANPLPLLIAAGIIGSAGGVIYNVTQVSLRQVITPQRLQGRMNATMRFIVWGTIPIGAFAGGVLGGAIGLRPTLWVTACVGMLAIIPVLGPSVRGIRSTSDPTTP